MKVGSNCRRISNLGSTTWWGLEDLEQRLLLSSQTGYAPASPLPAYGPAAVTAADDAETEIDSRIAGQAPSTALSLWSSMDEAGGQSFTWNANSWAAGLDFTCVSPWNDSISGEPGNRGGTLISPCQILFSKHYPFNVGDQISFVTTDGQTVCRSIVAVNALADTDLAIGLLDSDVPPGITPASVLPADYATYFPSDGTEIPVARLNIARQAGVWDTTMIETQGASSVGAFDALAFTHPSADLEPSQAAFSTTIINGDSGSPIFIILGNQPVLISLVTSGSDAEFWGPDVSDYIGEIDQVMAAQAQAAGLDPSADQLSVLDLAGLGYAPAASGAAPTSGPGTSHSLDDADSTPTYGQLSDIPTVYINSYAFALPNGQMTAEVPDAPIATVILEIPDLPDGATGFADGDFDLESSTDGVTWTPVAFSASLTNPQEASLNLDTPVSAEWLQVTINATVDTGMNTAYTVYCHNLPGDFNGDGLVDIADYDIWAANVGATNATLQMGDGNGDGLVDVADYDLWAASVGSTSNAPAIPAAVTNLVASVANNPTAPNTEVDMTWTPADPTTSAPNAGYIIYVGTCCDGTDPNYSPDSYVVDTNPGDAAFNVTGLTPNTEYYFQVVPYSSVGGLPTSNPGVVATTTLAGTVALDLTGGGNATAVTEDTSNDPNGIPSIHLTLDSAPGAVATLDVYRSTNPGELGTQIASGASPGAFCDDGTACAIANNQWYFYTAYAAGSVPEDYPTQAVQCAVETPTPPPAMGNVVAVHAIYEPGFVAPGMPGDEYLVGCQLPPTFGQTYWPAAYRQATYTTSIAGGGEGTETGPAEGWIFQSIDQGTYGSIQSAIADGQPDTSYSITVSGAEGGSSTTYLTWAGDATDPSGSWGYTTPASCPCTLWARGPQTCAADTQPAVARPDSKAFFDAYAPVNYVTIPPEQNVKVWEYIGGSLGKAGEDGAKKADQTKNEFRNTCATRVSRALNASGFIIQSANGTWVNKKQVKDDNGTAGDGYRYFIRAWDLHDYLAKRWGAPDTTLKTAADLAAFRKTLKPGQVAVFATPRPAAGQTGPGHSGMITDATSSYNDPYLAAGQELPVDVWILPLAATTQPG